MNRISDILKSTQGTFVVRASVGLLCAALLFSAGLSIFHVYHVFGRVRETINESVLAVAAANVAEFYGGSRESDGYARHPYNGGFAHNISSDVVDTLARSVGAADIGHDGTITVGDSYTITNISTQYVNSVGSILNFTTTVTVVVPLEVGGIEIPITKTMEVRSSYDTKF